jgi:toxin ParE1/3/4
LNPIEFFVRHDAELDAFGYFQYIWDTNPDADRRCLKAIDGTIEKLRLQPQMGRLRKYSGRDLQNIRSWRLDGFENYLIFYRLTKTRLEVLRIKQGAMDFPGALRKKSDI